MRKMTTFSFKHFSPSKLEAQSVLFVDTTWLLFVRMCVHIFFFMTSRRVSESLTLQNDQVFHQYTDMRVMTSSEIPESTPLHISESRHQYRDIRGIISTQIQVHRCQSDKKYPNVIVITSTEMSESSPVLKYQMMSEP